MQRLPKEVADSALDFGCFLYDALIESVLGNTGKDSILAHVENPHFDILELYCNNEMTYGEAMWVFINRQLAEHRKLLAQPDLEHATNDMPTQEQIEAGNLAAREMLDADISVHMGGLGGCRPLDLSIYTMPDIVEMYTQGEIDSITGI